jgi:hypothetical protein
MWKKLIAAVFLIAFVAQTFSKAVIIIDFYTNQKSIAEKFCVNKGKPEMHCCGKCQLCKRLKQEDSKDKQSPERKNDGKDEVLSSKSFFATCNQIRFFTLTIDYPSYTARNPVDRSFSIFHPPGQA